MAQQTQSSSRDDILEPNEYRTQQVVDGTVMRITGAGNLIVYPASRSHDINVGNPVKIVVAEKTIRATVSLEARQDPISTPISSNWAIIISGPQSIERCRVFYNRVQLKTVDHIGELRTEVRMPRAGSLFFRIPNSMELNDAYIVEVRDGDRLLRSESFGAIRTMPAPPSRV
jgi:hypothetical protein